MRPEHPNQRVLECQDIPDQSRQRLRRQFESLNPAALQRDVVRLQRQLLRMVAKFYTRRLDKAQVHGGVVQLHHWHRPRGVPSRQQALKVRSLALAGPSRRW